jgi:hypothetical protein
MRANPCEDAAAEIGAEVLLDPLRDAVAVGIGRGCLGEEGLDVVLDERVEGRDGGVAAAVDGDEAVGPGRTGRVGKAVRGSAQPVRVGAGVDTGRGCEGSRGGGMAGWADANGSSAAPRVASRWGLQSG